MAPPQKPGRSRQDLVILSESKFWSLIAVGQPNECWPWLRGCCAGYGWLYLGGGRANPINEYAHRLALFYKTGIFGIVAMHTCDNRRCCNPSHLVWADHKTNSQDALVKGRVYIGVKNSNTKLTEDIVTTIRQLRLSGATYKEIATITGTSLGNVGHIVHKETWKHVA